MASSSSTSITSPSKQQRDQKRRKWKANKQQRLVKDILRKYSSLSLDKDRDEKARLLSTLFPTFSFRMINDVVFKSVGIIISKYLWTLAGRHYLAFGPGGMLPKQEKQFRKRFNEEAIYELISFLTSKHNMEFWAHGDRLLQYSNGDIVTIPSVYNLLFSCSFTSQIRKLTEPFRSISDVTGLN